jgi:hypothetical protein
VIATASDLGDTSRVSAMKTFFPRAFIAGLAVGLLTTWCREYKMKKKNKLQNLGLTPASLAKAARRGSR